MSWDFWGPAAWSGPFTATIDAWTRAFADNGKTSSREEPRWATPNRVLLELPGLRLRCFSQGGAQTPAIVVAPYALHDAQLADLAPQHSLVSTLLSNGCDRVCLIEWRSATPATKLDTVDSQLSTLNVAVDDVGPPVDLIGLCQGGWLSLLYAGRFPEKVRKLVLAGAPVDVKAAASALSRPVDATPDLALDHLISIGDGLVRGKAMAHLWPREETEERRLANALQIDQPFASEEARVAVDAFRRWERRLLDLPGPYYREVIQLIYRENQLARGDFLALGKKSELGGLSDRLFILAGETDAIAPPPQALAAAKLVGGAATTALAPCSHLALFMGRETLRDQWPRIVRWLRGL